MIPKPVRASPSAWMQCTRQAVAAFCGLVGIGGRADHDFLGATTTAAPAQNAAPLHV